MKRDLSIRSIHLVISLVCFAIISSSCANFSRWKQEQKFKAYQDGKDFCGKHYLEKYIGTLFDDLDVKGHLPKKYTFRVADPRPYLETGVDSIFTTDLNYQRMSIYLDDQGIIKSLKCG